MSFRTEDTLPMDVCQYGISDAYKAIYDCALCSFLCSSQENFQNHIRDQHGKNFLPCITCGKLYSTSKTLIRHIDSTHKLFMYRCGKEGCKFSSSVYKIFLFHIVKCLSSSFPCYSCRANFSTPESLITHMERNKKPSVVTTAAAVSKVSNVVGEVRNSVPLTMFPPPMGNSVRIMCVKNVNNIRLPNAPGKTMQVLVTKPPSTSAAGVPSPQVIFNSVKTLVPPRSIRPNFTRFTIPNNQQGKPTGLISASYSAIPKKDDLKLVSPQVTAAPMVPLPRFILAPVSKPNLAANQNKSGRLFLPTNPNGKPVKAFTLNQGLMKGKFFIMNQTNTPTHSTTVTPKSADISKIVTPVVTTKDKLEPNSTKPIVPVEPKRIQIASAKGSFPRTILKPTCNPTGPVALCVQVGKINANRLCKPDVSLPCIGRVGSESEVLAALAKVQKAETRIIKHYGKTVGLKEASNSRKQSLPQKKKAKISYDEKVAHTDNTYLKLQRTKQKCNKEIEYILPTPIPASDASAFPKNTADSVGEAINLFKPIPKSKLHSSTKPANEIASTITRVDLIENDNSAMVQCDFRNQSSKNVDKDTCHSTDKKKPNAIPSADLCEQKDPHENDTHKNIARSNQDNFIIINGKKYYMDSGSNKESGVICFKPLSNEDPSENTTSPPVTVLPKCSSINSNQLNLDVSNNESESCQPCHTGVEDPSNNVPVIEKKYNDSNSNLPSHTHLLEKQQGDVPIENLETTSLAEVKLNCQVEVIDISSDDELVSGFSNQDLDDVKPDGGFSIGYRSREQKCYGKTNTKTEKVCLTVAKEESFDDQDVNADTFASTDDHVSQDPKCTVVEEQKNLKNSFAYCTVTETTSIEVEIELFSDSSSEEKCNFFGNCIPTSHSAPSAYEECAATSNTDEIPNCHSVSAPGIEMLSDSSMFEELSAPLVIDEDNDDHNKVGNNLVLDDEDVDLQELNVPCIPCKMEDVRDSFPTSNDSHPFLDCSSLTVGEILQTYKNRSTGNMPAPPSRRFRRKKIASKDVCLNQSDLDKGSAKSQEQNHISNNGNSANVPLPLHSRMENNSVELSSSVSSKDIISKDGSHEAESSKPLSSNGPLTEPQKKIADSFILVDSQSKEPLVLMDNSKKLKILYFRLTSNSSLKSASLSLATNDKNIPTSTSPPDNLSLKNSIAKFLEAERNPQSNPTKWLNEKMNFKNMTQYLAHLKERKSDLGLKKMSLSSDYFKCMHEDCTFTCNCPREFSSHSAQHNASEIECAYCLKLFPNADDLVAHSVQLHRRRIFQCSLCFYRACTKTHVFFHLQASHPKMSGHVITGTPINIELAKIPDESPTLRLCVQNIACVFHECKFSTSSLTDMAYHLWKHPERGSRLKCTMCDVKCLSILDWTIHIKVHDICLLNCLFCSYGCNKRLQMLNHLVSHHADLPLMTYVRTSEQLLFILEYYLNINKSAPFQSIQCCSSPSTCYCYLLSCPEFEGNSNRIKNLLENVKIRKMHFRLFECLYCENKASSIAKMERHLKNEHSPETHLKLYYCSSHPLSNSEVKEIFDFSKSTEFIQSKDSDKLRNSIVIQCIKKLKISIIQKFFAWSRLEVKYVAAYPFMAVTLPSIAQTDSSNISLRIIRSFQQAVKLKSGRQMFFACSYCPRRNRKLRDLRTHWKNSHVRVGKKFSYSVVWYHLYRNSSNKYKNLAGKRKCRRPRKDNSASGSVKDLPTEEAESPRHLNMYDRVKRKRAAPSIAATDCKRPKLNATPSLSMSQTKRSSSANECKDSSSCKKTKLAHLSIRNGCAPANSRPSSSRDVESRFCVTKPSPKRKCFTHSVVTVYFNDSPCPMRVPWSYLEQLLQLQPRVKIFDIKNEITDCFMHFPWHFVQ